MAAATTVADGCRMLWKKTGKRAVKTSDLTAFIDEGSEIEGKYTFSGTVMLNGRFKGEISTTDTLIIGDKAAVNGDVRAGRVLVSGEVVGNISGTERVELKRTARVFGDVDSGFLGRPAEALREHADTERIQSPGRAWRRTPRRPSRSFPMGHRGRSRRPPRRAHCPGRDLRRLPPAPARARLARPAHRSPDRAAGLDRELAGAH